MSNNLLKNIVILSRQAFGCVCFLVALWIGPPTAGAAPLTQDQAVARGKEATAMVEVTVQKGVRKEAEKSKPGKQIESVRTAFCVHSSGFFVTLDHSGLVSRLGAQVRLIVRAGTAREEVLEASVIRRDPEHGFLLLKTTPQNPIPAISLGTTEQLFETQELVTFGYPLGKDMFVAEGKYPAVSVNAGRVTSLRKKQGVLEYIQLDAKLTPGYGGGPVLNKAGQVVGIITIGFTATGLMFAVPVTHLEKFLTLPHIAISPKQLNRSTLREPVEFQGSFVSFLDPEPVTTAWLTISCGKWDSRRFQLNRIKGSYRRDVMPTPVHPAGLDQEVTVEFPEGSISGLAKGLPRDTRSLKSLQISVGGQQIELPIEAATRVQVQPLTEIERIRYQVVFYHNNSEVVRKGGSIEVVSPPAANNASARAAALIREPAFPGKTKEIVLPAQYQEVAVGGGGRYYIFSLPRVRKLAIFDINHGRVVHYIDTHTNDVRIAAEADTLLILRQDTRMLQRYSLKSFERLASFPLSFKDNDQVPEGKLGNLFRNENQSNRTDKIPNPNASAFFRRNAVYSPEGAILHLIPHQGRRRAWCLPGTDSLFYLVIIAKLHKERGVETWFLRGGLYILGDTRPLADIPNLHISYSGQMRDMHKRIYLIPQAKVVLFLPESNDRLVLQKLDPVAALQRAGRSFLYINTSPIETAMRGTEYQYSVGTLTKSKAVQYHLEYAPEGMKISQEGRITWPVPADFDKKEVSVIVHVTDQAQQNDYQSFRIRIQSESDSYHPPKSLHPENK